MKPGALILLLTAGVVRADTSPTVPGSPASLGVAALHPGERVTVRHDLRVDVETDLRVDGNPMGSGPYRTSTSAATLQSLQIVALDGGITIKTFGAALVQHPPPPNATQFVIQCTADGKVGQVSPAPTASEKAVPSGSCALLAHIRSSSDLLSIPATGAVLAPGAQKALFSPDLPPPDGVWTLKPKGASSVDQLEFDVAITGSTGPVSTWTGTIRCDASAANVAIELTGTGSQADLAPDGETRLIQTRSSLVSTRSVKVEP